MAVRRWHYSGTLPTPPRIMLGVWDDGKFIGVIIFSRGASRNLHRPFSIDRNKICELTRVALSEHTTPTSRIISIALKQLRKISPNTAIVVSFADPNHNHKGTLYHACNFIYAGRTASTAEYSDRSGRIFHERQVSASGFNKQYGELREVPKPGHLMKKRLLPKHRFVYVLDKSLRRDVNSLCEKLRSAAEVTPDDTAHDQCEKGGSTPTPPLQ